MRRVMFKVSPGKPIVYPDDPGLFVFGDHFVKDGYLHVDYRGVMPLDEGEAKKVESSDILMDKTVWLRNHLGETVEAAVSAHVAKMNTDDDSVNLAAFIAMVDRRDDIVLSDPGYKFGVLLIFSMGFCDEGKRDDLLSLGGHDYSPSS